MARFPPRRPPPSAHLSAAPGTVNPGVLECPPGMMNDPCRRWERGAFFFAQWSPETDPPDNLPTPVFSSARRLVSTGEDTPGWYNITMWGQSVVRSSADPLEPLAPAQISSIGANSSRARAVIGWSGPSGGTIRMITIGTGFTSYIYGCGVTVEVLAPPETTWGPRSSQNGQVVPTLTGTIVDEAVGAAVYLMADAPQGFNPAQLVDVVNVPAGLPAFLQPPPGARFLTLSQPGAAALNAANFVFLVGGNIQPVVMDAAQRTIRIAVPSHATELVLTGGAAEETMTAIWELDL